MFTMNVSKALWRDISIALAEMTGILIVSNVHRTVLKERTSKFSSNISGNKEVHASHQAPLALCRRHAKAPGNEYPYLFGKLVVLVLVHEGKHFSKFRMIIKIEAFDSLKYIYLYIFPRNNWKLRWCTEDSTNWYLKNPANISKSRDPNSVAPWKTSRFNCFNLPHPSHAKDKSFFLNITSGLGKK